MFNAKPPFKLAIASSFLDGATRDSVEVMAVMKKDYEGEKLFTQNGIDINLQSLKAVGILKIASENATHISYEITEYGRKKVQKAL